MTRDEAIAHIFGLSSSVEHEFCVTDEGVRALRLETEEALVAIGVSREEQQS